MNIPETLRSSHFDILARQNLIKLERKKILINSNLDKKNCTQLINFRKIRQKKIALI